jgi:CheY-like chemotaxis protein
MSQMIMIGAKDQNIAYLLQRYAEESGFQVTPVCQNDDWLDRVVQLQPTVIILDIDFVETADWAMLRRLKANPALRRLPMIVYSCLNEPPDDWRENVDGVILKSALYDDFVAVLKRATAEHFLAADRLTEEQTLLHDALVTDDKV